MSEATEFVRTLIEKMKEHGDPPALERGPAPSERPPDSVPANIDGYHFLDYQDHEHVFWYTEYWYFAFLDERSGYSVTVGHSVFNPKNELDLGKCGTVVVVHRPDGDAISQFDLYPVGDFSASVEKADVHVGPNSVVAETPERYRLRASTKDQPAVEVDVTFQQADAPRYLSQAVQGSKSWAFNSWVVYMPSARVTGTISIDGAVIPIDGNGYHDHSWGIWLLPARTWMWGVFCDPDEHVACLLGHDTAFYIDDAYLQIGDLNLRFPQAKMVWGKYDYHHWKLLYKYPTRVTFESEDTNGDYRLVCEWTVTHNAVIWKAPAVIFEQAARFRGALFKKDPQANGGWAEIRQLDYEGHSEYVDTWWGKGD